MVLAQPELLCDMLYNLIQNARKATPADGKVEVLLDETPTRLTICVQDTGCGIPPQELARITEPFYMVDKSRAREQGGSGMGLACAPELPPCTAQRCNLQVCPAREPRSASACKKRAANRRWSHEGKENVFSACTTVGCCGYCTFCSGFGPAAAGFLLCWTVPPGTALRCSRMLKR